MLLHDASPAAPHPLRLLRLAIVLLTVAALTPALALAQAEREKGLQLILADSTQKQLSGFTALAKYALVIGINEYDNKAQGISSLRYAVGDARAVYQALVDPRRGGFRSENATLLTDDSPEKPTNIAIGKALNRLVTSTREGDLVLVFFSGHGYEEQGRAYLLPANADLEALDQSAIERDAFVRQIDRLAAKKVIVVLDACHSGGVNRGGKGVGKDAALSTRYYENFAGSQGRAFIASSGGGELSWEDDDKGHGVFTSALVDALSGKADRQPRDGVISLNELRGYVETEVSDWAERRGKSQHPQVSLESAFGDIPLALDYSYLESQSKDLAERRDLVSRLKSGLTTIEGLQPGELAQAVAVLDRYGQGATISEPEGQHIEFVRKLVDGSIDLKMYRTGVAKVPPLATAAQIGLQKKPSAKLWIIGGVAVATAGAALGLAGGSDAGAGAPATPTALPAPPTPPGH
jgi:hypothetical protein